MDKGQADNVGDKRGEIQWERLIILLEGKLYAVLPTNSQSVLFSVILFLLAHTVAERRRGEEAIQLSRPAFLIMMTMMIECVSVYSM